MYEVIDGSNSLNLRTMEYDGDSRAKGSGGNVNRALWRTDRIGLLRITQDAGVGTVTKVAPVGFCYHSNCVEVEYLLDSVCDLTYPDGTHVTMNPGDALDVYKRQAAATGTGMHILCLQVEKKHTAVLIIARHINTVLPEQIHENL